MKYNFAHNGKHNTMAPVSFCLENHSTIGQDVDPDPNIYKCHPTTEQVYDEIVRNYKLKVITENKGKIIL
jgi:hypothetical protein